MSKQVEETLVYRVGIVRSDMSDPLYVFTSTEITEVKQRRSELLTEWKSSVDEKRPFNLEEQMRSFVPALVLEIRIDSMPYALYQRVSSDYEQQLQQSGTSNWMNNNFTR